MVYFGTYRFEVTMDLRSSSKVPSTHFPLKQKNDSVWKQRDLILKGPEMSIEEAVNVEATESFITVPFLLKFPVSFLQKPPA